MCNRIQVTNKTHKSQFNHSQMQYIFRPFPKNCSVKSMRKWGKRASTMNRFTCCFFGLWCDESALLFEIQEYRLLHSSSAFSKLAQRFDSLFRINFTRNRLSELDWNDCVSAFAFPSSSRNPVAPAFRNRCKSIRIFANMQNVRR